MVDQYIAAMVKHDPSGLPLTSDYKYTENTAAMPLGDGLWVGASEAPTTFKIYALDPVSHQAGLFAVMKEFDKPVILALRLKIENGNISEIEHVVARSVRESSLPNLTTPRPALLGTVPPAERVSRDEMWRIANSYFEAIEHSGAKTECRPRATPCLHLIPAINPARPLIRCGRRSACWAAGTTSTRARSVTSPRSDRDGWSLLTRRKAWFLDSRCSCIAEM
jgi:hypothetical protein